MNMVEYKKELTKYYDNMAKTMKPREAELPKRKLSFISEFATAESTILDIGCGNGEYSIPLAKRTMKVYAIDISDKMLKEIQARAESENIRNIETMNADAKNPHFKDGSFDVVFSYSTLYHIDDLDQTFKEIRRVLKKDGMFIFDMINKNSLGGVYYKKKYQIPQFFRSENEIELFTKRNRLKVIRRHYFELIPRFKIFIWVLNLKLGGRTLDEIISSLPFLRRFASRFVFICKKVE